MAAFSPACVRGDAAFQEAGRLKGTPVGLGCGLQNSLLRTVQALEQVLPAPKAAGAYADGRHTRRYWNRCTPAAFGFLAAELHR